MDASTYPLLSFLSNRQELSIPIYQRKYNWSTKECEQLWKDILNVGRNDDMQSYFIGSIVYLKENAHRSSHVDDITVIDGQQRVTTISLIIAALCDYFKSIGDEDSFYDWYEFYLIDRRSKNKYKLFLTDNDRHTFEKIIDSLDIDKELLFDDNDSVSIRTNYHYFTNLINEDNLEILKTGLDKLIFIDVALEPGKDNPQLIFESLNSTGKELSKSDLIRNYILMGLDSKHQNQLYTNYWCDIEDGFVNEDALFDSFIRDYLTVKLGRIPIRRDVYDEFKVFSSDFDSVDDLVKDIYKYAGYFFNMFLDRESDVDLKIAFMSLNSLGFDVTRPFLLSLYDDYKSNKDDDNNNILSKNGFIKIIKYVESYCLRRNICNIPTASLNKTFSKLHSTIDKENYINSFIAELLSYDSYKKFPNDNEVIESLKTKDIYNSRKDIRNHILYNLENYDNKEIVNLEECTIEHILPQNKNLSDEWISDLGENYQEIQDKYLHTLGNITLTAYNNEMSDKSFNEKKTIKGGFIDSKLSLNKSLASLDKWDEEAIINRTQELSEKFVNIYKYPEINDNITEILNSKQETTTEYNLDDFEYLQEKTNTRKLYDLLTTILYEFDNDITQTIHKYIINFKRDGKIFVELSPLKKGLRVTLTIPLNKLNNPQVDCKDVSKVGKWETGVTRTYLQKEEELYKIMDVIKQSYEYVKNF